MNSISTRMTAQTPSPFGMPIFGSAFGATCPTGTGLAPVVRDRDVAGRTAVKGAFPGTSAWRPPIC
jgi:hypothetical protein